MATTAENDAALAQQLIDEGAWADVSATDPDSDATTKRLRVNDGWLYRTDWGNARVAVMAFVPQESLGKTTL